jgi:hypothetical protein
MRLSRKNDEKRSEIYEKREAAPLTFLGGTEGGYSSPSRHQAEVMLPEILQRQKLFSLLHNIDIDLAAGVQARGCLTVRGRCITGHMHASPAAVPPACPKHFLSDIGIDDR